MHPRSRPSVLVAIFTAALLALIGVFGAPPAARDAVAANYYPPPLEATTNDNFASPVIVDSMPFYYMEETWNTSLESGEPITPSCMFDTMMGSVWFAFTPSTDGIYTASAAYNYYVEIFTGETIDTLTSVSEFCGWEGSFTATAGERYYIRVAFGQYTFSRLLFSVTPPPPPSVSIGTWTSDTVPGRAVEFFAYVYDPLGIGIESCTWDFGDGTTADTCENVTHTYQDLGEYIVKLTATTFDKRSGSSELGFTVRDLYLPSAYFSYNPNDPSTLDTIWFENWSYDPEGYSIDTWLWEFGDGATSTDASTSHKYAATGDYPVTLTVTTVDGRSASTTQIVQVRNRDASIVKLSVPQSARAGQSREIVVSVTSNQSAEYVRVTLTKSTSSGAVNLGNSTQLVPIRSGNRTTSFSFRYVYTDDDAQVGKVTFIAHAEIVAGFDYYGWTLRDMFPLDNQQTATTTKVTK